MIVAVADTHTLLWHMYDDPRISSSAQQVFFDAVESGNRIGVSTISLVEILYLQEKNRVPAKALNRVDNELGSPSQCC